MLFSLSNASPCRADGYPPPLGQTVEQERPVLLQPLGHVVQVQVCGTWHATKFGVFTRGMSSEWGYPQSAGANW